MDLEVDGVALLKKLLLVEQTGDAEEVLSNLSPLLIFAYNQPAVVRLTGNSFVQILKVKWKEELEKEQ